MYVMCNSIAVMYVKNSGGIVGGGGINKINSLSFILKMYFCITNFTSLYFIFKINFFGRIFVGYFVYFKKPEKENSEV